MKQILIPLAVICGKAVGFFSKLMGNKGSSMPGKIARIIYPKILSHLGVQVKKEILVVTGTNGKTTTNNMLRDIFKTSGYKVVCNDVGANMINGVTSAFINSANLFGKLNTDFACIETDEASLHKIVDEITPNKIVITNLFRDQLDRYGEIDLTIQFINKALDKLQGKSLTLILNADDPLTAQFKFRYDFNAYFYGLNDSSTQKSCEESREGRFCTFCGEELIYNFYYYSQLGDYYCSKCNFARPSCDYYASKINILDNINFDLNYNSNTENITLNYTGLYNVYNCLAAVSAALNTNIKTDQIRNALVSYKPQIGRMERFEFSKPVVLNLSKNPAGFNQAISTVANDRRKKDLLIAINDNAQDGKDISWLWDCDFENLASEEISTYYVSGIRKEDMALRLKYAGISTDKIIIESDIKKAITTLLESQSELIYVLVNYTALFNTQNILKDLQGVYGMDVKK